MNSRLLIIDDDEKLNLLLTDYLGKMGFEVLSAVLPEEGLQLLEKKNPDLVILDVMLPEMDGFEVCRKIRQSSIVPVIMLTARGEVMDRVVGLEIGADDYLPKPFEPRELLARTRSVLRRSESLASVTSSDEGTSYEFDGWSLNINRREFINPAGDHIDLTSGEFDFLKVFVEHPNRVLSRDQILEIAYTNDSPAYDRSVDIRIARLRKKIEQDPKAPQWIKTVRNAGYIFTATVSSNS